MPDLLLRVIKRVNYMNRMMRKKILKIDFIVVVVSFNPKVINCQCFCVNLHDSVTFASKTQ
jgi:hypothetical protein